MKLNARQDIDAAPAAVFRALADFDHWERAALRRGVDVQRTDPGADTAALPVSAPRAEPPPWPVAGMAWRIGFSWRGRPRRLAFDLAAIDVPHALRFAGASAAAEGTLAIDVVALGARRTRLSMSLEVKPRTLAARLFIQSLRLARGRVATRFDNAVAFVAANITDRIARAPRGDR